MKQLKLMWLSLAILGGILFCSTDAKAISYALTDFNYDVSAGKVYGTSQTYLDYSLDPYYNAGVDGYLVKYTDDSLTNAVILNSGTQNHGNNAIVLTVANVQRGETYAVFSDHFLQTTVYYYGYPYDPYGISGNYFGSGGGNPYYGFQGTQPVFLQSVWFYIGRTGVIVSLPNITQLAPDAALPGTTPAVQIVGKFIGEHRNVPPVVSVSGSGVTAQFSNFTPNGVEVFLQVAEDADTGNHTLSLTSDGVPSNSVNFRVGDRTPQITGITPPQGNTGEQVTVSITGTGFGVNPQVQIAGTGVNATTVTPVSPTEIQAVFSVADATYIGDREVKVKSNGRLGMGFTQGAGNSDTSNGVNFSVFKPRIEIEAFDSLESYGKRNVKITIYDAKPSSTFRAYIQQGRYSGGVVFDENSQVGLDIAGNGVKIIKIKSLGYESLKLNDWTLTVIGSGAETKTERFTVSTVKFEEESVCSGFDDVETSNHYLMVPQNGSNKVKVKITPAGATGNFRLEGLEQNGVTASPNTISGEQVVTVNAGNISGEYTLQALGNESTQAAKVLKIAVRKKINKTVVIHAVTEDNDDVEKIPPGNGEANQIAIEPAPRSKNLTTQITGGDDMMVLARNSRGLYTHVINTGLNGIRETVISGTDVKLIEMNEGKPNSMCISVGSNGFADSNLAQGSDDIYDSTDNILSGPKGICDSVVRNTDIVPAPNTIPSATDLQTYLNDTAWGKQANVFFTVTRAADSDIHFDENGDGLIDPVPDQELGVIGTKLGDNEADKFHLYYTGMSMKNNPAGNTPNALSYFPTGDSLFSKNNLGTRVYQAAHEIGHLLGRSGESSLALDLMYQVDSANSPCRIRKADWDLISVANP